MNWRLARSIPVSATNQQLADDCTKQCTVNPEILTLYRRHSSNCKVQETGLTTRGKREFNNCDCPIRITGKTDTELYPHRSTGLTDMTAAEALKTSL